MSKQAEAASGSVLDVAGNVGRTADTLRTEVTDFIAAMSSGDEPARRRYERIPGRGARAVLLVGGHQAGAVVQEISRGGITLLCDVAEEAGTQIDVILPPGAAAMPARVISAADGLLVAAFSQDSQTLARVDHALDLIDGSPAMAA